MAKTKKVDIFKKQKEENPKVVEKKETKNTGVYKTYQDLTDEEIEDLIFYENFCERVAGRYVKTFNKKDIINKYGHCSIPPFVLRTIHLLRKNESIL